MAVFNPAKSRLLKELSLIEKDPVDYCTVQPIEGDLFKWVAHIHGPPFSPYHGGTFCIKIYFPEKYPHHTPRVHFHTKIFHPNIKSTGEVCLGMLGKDWVPSMTVAGVLRAICALLSDPETTDALVPSIAKMYLTDREKYLDMARRTTRAWAMPPTASSVPDYSQQQDDDAVSPSHNLLEPAATFVSSAAGEPALTA